MWRHYSTEKYCSDALAGNDVIITVVFFKNALLFFVSAATASRDETEWESETERSESEREREIKTKNKKVRRRRGGGGHGEGASASARGTQTAAAANRPNRLCLDNPLRDAARPDSCWCLYFLRRRCPGAKLIIEK